MSLRLHLLSSTPFSCRAACLSKHAAAAAAAACPEQRPLDPWHTARHRRTNTHTHMTLHNTALQKRETLLFAVRTSAALLESLLTSSQRILANTIHCDTSTSRTTKVVGATKLMALRRLSKQALTKPRTKSKMSSKVMPACTQGSDLLPMQPASWAVMAQQLPVCTQPQAS